MFKFGTSESLQQLQAEKDIILHQLEIAERNMQQRQEILTTQQRALNAAINKKNAIAKELENLERSKLKFARQRVNDAHLKQTETKQKIQTHKQALRTASQQANMLKNHLATQQLQAKKLEKDRANKQIQQKKLQAELAARKQAQQALKQRQAEQRSKLARIAKARQDDNSNRMQLKAWVNHYLKEGNHTYALHNAVNLINLEAHVLEQEKKERGANEQIIARQMIKLQQAQMQYYRIQNKQYQNAYYTPQEDFHHDVDQVTDTDSKDDGNNLDYPDQEVADEPVAEQIDTLNEELTEAASDYSDITEAINHTENDYQHANEEVENLTEAINQEQQALDTSEQQLEAATSELQSTEHEYQELNESLNAVDATVTEHSNAIENATTDFEQAQNDYHDAQSQLAQNEQELAAAEEQAHNEQELAAAEEQAQNEQELAAAEEQALNEQEVSGLDELANANDDVVNDSYEVNDELTMDDQPSYDASLDADILDKSLADNEIDINDAGHFDSQQDLTDGRLLADLGEQQDSLFDTDIKTIAEQLAAEAFGQLGNDIQDVNDPGNNFTDNQQEPTNSALTDLGEEQDSLFDTDTDIDIDIEAIAEQQAAEAFAQLGDDIQDANDSSNNFTDNQLEPTNSTLADLGEQKNSLTDTDLEAIAEQEAADVFAKQWDNAQATNAIEQENIDVLGNVTENHSLFGNNDTNSNVDLFADAKEAPQLFPETPTVDLTHAPADQSFLSGDGLDGNTEQVSDYDSSNAFPEFKQESLQQQTEQLCTQNTEIYDEHEAADLLPDSAHLPITNTADQSTFEATSTSHSSYADNPNSFWNSTSTPTIEEPAIVETQEHVSEESDGITADDIQEFGQDVVDKAVDIAHEVGAISEEVKENLNKISEWGEHIIDQASQAIDQVVSNTI